MRSVLITGASSGIGRATAQRLARRGLAVWATARRPAALEGLGGEGCRTLRLDVTDEEERRLAVTAVEDAHGQVDVLVNNVGYGQYGAVEDVGPDEARRQLETNVLAPARLAQLVLPGMRAAGRGTIVNVSSMGGRLTFPGSGWYHASKHALESLSDALRFEVAALGVDVVLVEPGLIATGFPTGAVGTAEATVDPTGPYGRMITGVQRLIAGSYDRLAADPEAVARTIERAVTARAPRSRYRVTLLARVLVLLRWLLPDRLWDAMLGTWFPRPRGR